MSEIELPAGIIAEKVNGLDAVRVDTPAATGLVYLQGAQVVRWAPAGSDEVLWLSEQSLYEPGKAIRGGIPVCWPWFGPGRDVNRTPAHGIARTSAWRLVAGSLDDDGTAHLTFELTPADVADTAGFDDFTLQLAVTMGQQLHLALTTTAGAQPMEVEEALHTYFTVSDVDVVRVEGLEGATYLDKLTGAEQVQQGAVTFTAETDRVYWSQGTTSIVDGERRVQVAKAGSGATVVWNPWVAKAAAMADFGDDEWRGMCCVETTNCLQTAVVVPAGGSHTMELTLQLGE